jgi:hypothetical protein
MIKIFFFGSIKVSAYSSPKEFDAATLLQHFDKKPDFQQILTTSLLHQQKIITFTRLK